MRVDDQEFEENEVYAIDIVVRALRRACRLALGVNVAHAPSRVRGSGSCGTVVLGPCERGASLMQVRGRAGALCERAPRMATHELRRRARGQTGGWAWRGVSWPSAEQTLTYPTLPYYTPT